MSHVDDGMLHAYLDGELSPVERSRLDAHLAECLPCRDRLAEERGLIERADRLLGLATPPAGHVNRPVPLPRRRPRFVVPGVWAASVAAAFLAGWILRPRAAFQRADATEVRQVADAPVPTDPTSPTGATPVAPAYPRGDQASQPPRPSQVMRLERASEAKVADSAVGSDEGRVGGKAIVPGVVGGTPAPALRGAAPTPIPPTAVAITPPSGLAAADAPARRNAIGTTWTVISAEPARRVLGTDVVRIPGLPVRDILQSQLEPGAVMVEQEVAEGTVIQLLQSRIDTSTLFGITADLRRTVGSLQVRISGPLSTDSLLKLLQLAR